MGGGISGHTVATYARKWLPPEHEVIVVTPNKNWNFIPSNVWVSMGKMEKSNVQVPLSPIYKKAGISYKQAKAISIHPEGNINMSTPYITIEYTSKEKIGTKEKVEYDYLINATGPKFDYGATEGLGKNTDLLADNVVSICTAEDSEKAYEKLQNIFKKAKNGHRQKVLVGTSHGMCGCQAAALMYLLNLEYEAKQAGVSDMINFKWITNEAYLGELGVEGIHMKQGKKIVSSEEFTKKLFRKKEISWILGAHVYKVESNKIKYELLDGSYGEEEFDLAMLLPRFVGAGLSVENKYGDNITKTLFAPNGFMLVDATYNKESFQTWKSEDWPKTYQNKIYNNIFACGTAFAPPHSISKPMYSPRGTPIFPGAPRAGLPSSIIAKTVAKSVCNKILYGDNAEIYKSSMSEIGSVCFATAGKGFKNGLAATLTIFPVVPNYEKYPEIGRDLKYAYGEFSLAGHWAKYILHHLSLYKAKLKFGWSYIL